MAYSDQNGAPRRQDPPRAFVFPPNPVMPRQVMVGMTTPLAKELASVIREVFDAEPPETEAEREVLALAGKIETHIAIAAAKGAARREKHEAEADQE
jgi:hypothetical protein